MSNRPKFYRLRQTLTAWFNVNEEPYVNDKGYASMASTYAEDGTQMDNYYDAEGNEVYVEQCSPDEACRGRLRGAVASPFRPAYVKTFMEHLSLTIRF